MRSGGMEQEFEVQLPVSAIRWKRPLTPAVQAFMPRWDGGGALSQSWLPRSPVGYSLVMSDALVVKESNVKPESWSDAVRGEVSFRMLFGDPLSTPEFTAGVSELAAGGWLGDHRHEPAELYY